MENNICWQCTRLVLLLWKQTAAASLICLYALHDFLINFKSKDNVRHVAFLRRLMRYMSGMMSLHGAAIIRTRLRNSEHLDPFTDHLKIYPCQRFVRGTLKAGPGPGDPALLVVFYYSPRSRLAAAGCAAPAATAVIQVIID